MRTDDVETQNEQALVEFTITSGNLVTCDIKSAISQRRYSISETNGLRLWDCSQL